MTDARYAGTALLGDRGSADTALIERIQVVSVFPSYRLSRVCCPLESGQRKGSG